MSNIKKTFEVFNGDKDSMSWVKPNDSWGSTKDNIRKPSMKFRPNDWKYKLEEAIEEAIDYNVEIQSIVNYVFDYLKRKKIDEKEINEDI